jgi:hypothetical protein
MGAAWEDTMEENLVSCYKVAGGQNFYLILPTDDNTRLYTQDQFPASFAAWEAFAKLENSKLLAMPAPRDRGCQIHCTIKCGFNSNPHCLLDQGDVDFANIQTRIRIQYKYIKVGTAKRTFT